MTLIHLKDTFYWKDGRIYNSYKLALSEDAQRSGEYIETYSGKKFYITDPREADVDIGDIAHALSNLCRFGGHAKKFYSVAEHSTNVAHCLYAVTGSTKIALSGLLHDASEAYLVDIPSPIKPSLSNYKELEKAIQDKIYTKFGVGNIAAQNHLKIKETDEYMLYAEAATLLPSGGKDWPKYGKWKYKLAEGELKVGRPPEDAKALFLWTFETYSV